jgi:phosphinothricin acetyltransferase
MTTIRALVAADWPQVQGIYAAGIATGNATFEAEPPDWEHFDSGKVADLRFVAEAGGVITGWVAASPVSARPAYRGVVEHSVYVAPEAAGQGLGRLLLDAFLTAADEAGYWTVQSSIFPENEPSLRLHRSAGFREVGRRERIALMPYGPYAGQWRDTILVERRRPD